MAEVSYPFEDTDVSESQFSAWAAAMVGTGIVEGLTLAPDSGMDLALAPGAAMVRGVYYENDAAKTLTVGAAPASGTRRDYVVLHLDMAANTVVAEVKAGTANGSGGALPTLTQTATEWEHPVGIITVASGTAALASGMVTLLNHDQGLRVYTWDEPSARPTPTESHALGLNRADTTWWFWAGAAWAQFGHQVDWNNIQNKPTTFPPTTPVNAATLNGKVWNHGTSLPGAGTAVGDVFYLHS